MTFSPAYPERGALAPAYPDIDTLGPAYPVDGVFPNLYSAKFVQASSQFASISVLNLGAYSDTKISFCVTVVRSSIGTAQGIVGVWDNVSSRRRFGLHFTPTNLLVLSVRTAAGVTYTITTTAAFTSTVDKLNIQPYIDLANGTQADRMIIEVGGVRQAVTGSPPPTAGDSLNAAPDSSLRVGIHDLAFYADSTIDEFTLYSNALPPYSDSWDGSGNVKDRSGVTGHYTTARFENDWTLVGIATDLSPTNAPTFVSNP